MVKKLVLVILGVVLCFGISWAEEKTEDIQSTPIGTQAAVNQDKDDMSMGKKDPGSKDGMKDMMKMMMSKSMIASSDGGVIILVGNKLQKYDTNLNLIKEVEIKMECPMMSKMPMMGMKKAGMDMPGMQASEESK